MAGERVCFVPLNSISFTSFTNMHESVSGTLKGYDQLMNLVLDDVKESMRGK